MYPRRSCSDRSFLHAGVGGAVRACQPTCVWGGASLPRASVLGSGVRLPGFVVVLSRVAFNGCVLSLCVSLVGWCGLVDGFS